MPLLIGGATTSRAHTAVKIAPNYPGPVVYVPDASRCVGVCSNLLSAELREAYVAEVRADYETDPRAARRQEGAGALLSIAEARAPRPQDRLAAPTGHRRRQMPGVTVLTRLPDLDEARSPTSTGRRSSRRGSCQARIRAILEDPVVGEAARKLHRRGAGDARRRSSRGRWLTASGVFGLFPAARVNGDDIEIYTDETRSNVADDLAQPAPAEPEADRPRQSVPRRLHRAQGLRRARLDRRVRGDAGIGIENASTQFETQHDDYSAIMLKALADRLAEAFAEHLHERVRREFWGYAAEEKLSETELIAEKYRGIRPAPGYPACPDHTEKRALFDLLEAEKNAGMTLTESFAMLPASSVSGFYFSHPESSYFAVGKLGRDQVEDYARRKSMTLEEIERWLAPYLGYEPSEA